MNKLFNQIAIRRPKSNSFDLSHEKKLSMKMGELVPILCQEVVPGDKFRVNTETLIRMAPLVAPVMHRVNSFIHFFFVPNRLTFSEWEKFITGGVDGLDTTVFPKITIDETWRDLLGISSLGDYMGLPVPPALTEITQNLEFSALPFRAYQMIYNEYYRDQTLHNPVPFGIGSTVSEGDRSALMTIRKRCWEKDYFTSALKEAQRGGEVLMPMDAQIAFVPSYKQISAVKTSNGADGTGALTGNEGELEVGATTGRIENLENELYGVDSSITINELRRATKLQQWLEKNARGGSRYIEQIFSHFGVRSSDARLQRPEYLGGGKTPIVISEVLNNSATATEPQGNMSGHGIGVGKTNSFSKFFEEHGYIIGIMSVLPRTAYQQGIDRSLIKFDKFDYYFPEFANIGEQEVLNQEIYHDFGNVVAAGGTFGYQSRYAEYKFKQSSVHGDFRDSLYHWHMGRIFVDSPSLNGDFVESDPDTRIFAVIGAESDKLYVQIYNDVKAIRPMPVFGTPSL